MTKLEAEWLSGVVDSDGCFSLTGRVITFKISLTHKNRQLLEKAKSILGCGKIKRYGSMITLRVRDQKNLKERVFPIFRKTGLFTHKYHFFRKAEHALEILMSNQLIEEQQ